MNTIIALIITIITSAPTKPTPAPPPTSQWDWRAK